MTSEQIGRLRKGLGSTPTSTLQEDMLRLLDEREAMLAALKAFAPFVDKRGACTAPQCLRSYVALADAYGAAQAAIAKAESP